MDELLGRVHIGNIADDSSEGEESDGGEQELEVEEQLPITAAEVERNYSLMGVLSQPEDPIVSLDQLKLKYPQAFTPVSESALAAVLAELHLPFTLSPFQVEFWLRRYTISHVSP